MAVAEVANPHAPGKGRARQQERRRALRAGRWALRLVLSSLGLGLLYGLMSSAWFRIDSVAVRCQREAVGREAARALSIPPGATTLTLRDSTVRRQLQSCPRVARVHVARHLPHAIVITVEPREPAMAVLTPTAWFLADRDAICIERVASAPPRLPRVKGIPVLDLRPGDRLAGPRVEAAWQAIRCAQRFPALDQLTVDVSSLEHIVVFSPGGTKGILGRPLDLGTKLARFAAALESFREQGWRAEYVDVRRVDLPAVWKPLPGHAPPAAGS